MAVAQIPGDRAEALWADEGILRAWVDLLELEKKCQRW